MTTQVEIFNQALSLIGKTERVQSPTETSVAAQNCSLWYDQARRLVLSVHPWFCATRVARLALDKARDWDAVWVNTDPPEPWYYSYGLPSDCLRPQYLTTFGRFRPGNMQSGKQVIFTNEYQPVLHYTFDETRPEIWDPDLRQAISTTLAAFISHGMTGERTLTRDLVNQVGMIINQAALAQANTEDEEFYSAPEGLTARAGAYTQLSNNYVYPNAQLVVSGVTYEG